MYVKHTMGVSIHVDIPRKTLDVDAVETPFPKVVMPISYRPDADLLQSEAEALVNPVNCVGIMGKGLAKGFKDAFPHTSEIYVRACKAARLSPGMPYIVKNHDGSSPRWIVHAPTKETWRAPSDYGWIEEIVSGIRWFALEHSVRSIAVPKLGCGEGGLNWKAVHALIVRWLGDLPDVEIIVYGEEIPA
jgi:O-acetyl-ADP-ribose deacetylase (regulator of RNase III)